MSLVCIVRLVEKSSLLILQCEQGVLCASIEMRWTCTRAGNITVWFNQVTLAYTEYAVFPD